MFKRKVENDISELSLRSVRIVEVARSQVHFQVLTYNNGVKSVIMEAKPYKFFTPVLTGDTQLPPKFCYR